MPLTFAHPAAILPAYGLRKRGLPFMPLIIGSMSPDFEYFLRLKPVSTVSHTLPGVVIFCIPAGVVALIIYYAAIPPLYSRFLPPTLQSKLPEEFYRHGRFGIRFGLATLIALSLGALTHIAWDAFTHFNGVAVLAWPVLQAQHFGLPAYKLLQHSSTLLGLTAIGVWAHRLPIRSPLPRSTPRIGSLVVAVVIATAWFLALAFLKSPNSPGVFVVEVIDAAILTAICLGIWYRLCDRSRSSIPRGAADALKPDGVAPKVNG